MLARLAFLLAVLAAPSASAQPYLGGSIGQAKYRDACAGASAGITCESGDAGLRFFGGYSFTRHFALEIGYGALGTMRASTGESVDLAAADLSAIGSWPIGNHFSVHGRLGVYWGDMTGRSVSPPPENALPCPVAPPGFPQPLCPPPASSPERGWHSGGNTDITYGLGLGYAITERDELRLQWQRFHNFGGADGPKLEVDFFSLGVLVHFQ